jgi:hypothetical protein
MPPRRTWLTLVLIIAAVELLLLVAQYFLGLWTNVYAPAMFTSNSSSPSLDWHYNVGFILFFVGIVLVVISGLSRDWRLLLGAVVVLLAVFSAGSFGGDYVSSSPNNPIDSFGMGAMFLVALFADAAVLLLSGRARRTVATTPTAVPAEPHPS